jgi:solute carrier family 6 (neurotransmitter transporter)
MILHQVLSIASFKSGGGRELYDWAPGRGYRFWPSWSREVGSLVQLLPLLAVPFVAIIQSCRYLSQGPPDLFLRLQQLYRPNASAGNSSSSSSSSSGASDRSGASGRSDQQDPPPKYTPPPSYSTATGAK